MRQGSNSRRPRSRGNGKRHPNSKNKNFESTGPDGKVRGSSQQVLDKYLGLARDALTAGDRVAAENYFQFADHYYRVVHAATATDGQQAGRPNNNNQGNRRQPQRNENSENKGEPETVPSNQPVANAESVDAAANAEQVEPTEPATEEPVATVEEPAAI